MALALRQKLESERSLSREPTPLPSEPEEDKEGNRDIVVVDDEDVTNTQDLL